MFGGLRGLVDLINNGAQRVGNTARAVTAQVNPNDNGETYNTSQFKQYQKQHPTQQQYAPAPGGGRVWEDDAIVDTSQGVMKPLREISVEKIGKPVQWQNPSNGASPTGWVSPSYSASADAWAKRNRGGW